MLVDWSMESREGLCGWVELVTPEHLSDARMSELAEAAADFRCMVAWRRAGAPGVRLLVRLDGGAVADRLEAFDTVLGPGFRGAVVAAEPDEVAMAWQKLWARRS